jgi:hypothetical protein
MSWARALSWGCLAWVALVAVTVIRFAATHMGA